MFGNFSMPELLIVGAIALIVIGPKDLPRMMRSIGKFVGQARGMARQFQRSMDDAAREMDVQEFKEAKALMDKRADTDAFTSPFTSRLSLDDDDDDEEEDARPKNPAMSADEMAEAVKKEGFSDEPKPAKADTSAQVKAEPLPDTDAEAAPAEAKQG